MNGLAVVQGISTLLKCSLACDQADCTRQKYEVFIVRTTETSVFCGKAVALSDCCSECTRLLAQIFPTACFQTAGRFFFSLLLSE